MLLDIIIFLLTLFVLLESVYIVFLSKKEIDRAFRFISGAVIVFALRAMFNFSPAYTSDQMVKYFDLLFMIMLLLGLSYMVDCCQKKNAADLKQEKTSRPAPKLIAKKIVRKK
jgi:hypothetical protein